MIKMVKCKLNGQFDIVLPEHRANRPEWYTEQGWERKRLDHMHSTIKKNDVVYYVGSEEADMTALCALWGARVVLFEPNPKVWSNARAIWEANDLPTPFTFQGFCSTETEIIDQPNSFKKGWPECASLPIEAAHGFKELDKEATNYNQTRIDDIVKQYLPPKHIMLDVEGSEGHVLRGAENTLREHRPNIYLSLHPEFLRENFDEWGAELRKWIIDIGYKETLIDYPLHECHLVYEALDE